MQGCYFLPGLSIMIADIKAAGERMNYTYIVECRDKSLYTGWTTDIEKRIAAHNEGKGAKYTKSRRPVKLVYTEEHETKNDAMKREYAIKRMTRQEKLAMIEKAKVQIHT